MATVSGFFYLVFGIIMILIYDKEFLRERNPLWPIKKVGGIWGPEKSPKYLIRAMALLFGLIALIRGLTDLVGLSALSVFITITGFFIIRFYKPLSRKFSGLKWSRFQLKIPVKYLYLFFIVIGITCIVFGFVDLV